MSRSPGRPAMTAVPIPPVTREFYEYMHKLFPQKQFRIGMDKDELVMSAGEQRVLRAIRGAVRSFELTGDFKALDAGRPDKKPWYARVLPW